MPISTVKLPAASKIAEVASKGFRARPPILNGDCDFPTWASSATTAISYPSFFPDRLIELYMLQNVYVCGEGLVYDEDGRSFSQIDNLFSSKEVVAGHRLVQQSLFDGVVEHCEVPAVLCKRPTPFVYGHWLIDMLPMAFMALRHLPIKLAGDINFVLHRTGCTIDSIMVESLQRLGVQRNRLLWTTATPVFFKSLIVVYGMTDHGRYISPHVDDCLTEVAAGVTTRGIARLFIKRQGGYGRELRNEQQLAQIARDAGFYVIDPGVLRLEEQIAFFKNADHIIGPIGSAMANVVYAPHRAQITVLTPRSMPDTFYWLLCQLRCQTYREVRCEEVGEAALEGRPPWHRDFSLQASRFQTALEDFG